MAIPYRTTKFNLPIFFIIIVCRTQPPNLIPTNISGYTVQADHICGSVYDIPGQSISTSVDANTSHYHYINIQDNVSS